MSATLVETLGVPTHTGIWPQYPSLYEINTWVWLSELSQKYQENITLSSVPAAEWDDMLLTVSTQCG